MDYSEFLTRALALKAALIAHRRDFHGHPELGFQETRTAGIVADALRNLKLNVETGVAETGVVATLTGGKPGSTVLVRFDMDALPIQERSDAPYASKVPGVMHACGHDGHTAVGIALANVLASVQSKIAGSVRFVFQPAEEGLGGAERMVKAGVLTDPEPACALAFHLWNERPVGWIGITTGPVMAGAELFEITITGRGGHGAIPHEAVDPLLAATHFVTSVQSVVSRNVDPLESAVVSVTQINAGDAFNVIPEKAILHGTIRTFKPQIRAIVLQRLEEVATSVAAAMGCTAEVKIQQLTPPVVNDARLAETVRCVAQELFPNATLCDDETTMTSEDMAFMMDSIPGCYILMGSGNPDKGLSASHHNPRFDFDEDVLPNAVALLAAAVCSLLEGA